MTTTKHSTISWRFTIAASLTLLALWSSFASAAIIPITAGQLVSIRVGDGTTTPGGTALPVTLDVYNVTYSGANPVGVTFDHSIALPTTVASTGNRALEQGGTAAGEGGLTLSTNGQYMALVGYNSATGGLTNGTGNTESRVVGRLELSTGNVDTSTALTDIGSGNAIRNAFTTDGTSIWTANSANGVRYTTFGATATAVGGTLTATSNERRVYVYNSQLYTTRQSAPVDGVATVGSGTPTSGAQTVTLLNGMPIVNTNESAYDYFFADANTLYVADDRNTGGLQKWTFSGSTWSLAYNVLVGNLTGAARGIKSLGGYVDPNGNVVLFGANADTSANILYGFGDTLTNTNGANVTVYSLVNSSTAFTGALWNLRGVAIQAPAPVEVPEPATFGLVALGCLSLVGRRSRKA